jgi:hypothetical protein
MTKDNWLTVAMIIAVIITAAATLLGPVLAVIVQVRMSQPSPVPTESQPKDTHTKLRRLRNFLWSPWLYLTIVLVDIGLLVIEYKYPSSGTYPPVFSVAGLMSSLFFNLANASIMAIWRQINNLWNTNQTLINILNTHTKLIEHNTNLQYATIEVLPVDPEIKKRLTLGE